MYAAKVARIAMAGLLGLSLAPAFAHHSFAMFDRSRTVSITGTIKTVEWTNPHVWIWVSVPNNGSLVDWGLESGGPSQMNRMGIPRALLKTGDKFSAEVYPMKDGRPGGSFKTMTLADGRTIDMQQSVKAFAAGGQTVDGAK
jgi:hypothetical protein